MLCFLAFQSYFGHNPYAKAIMIYGKRVINMLNMGVLGSDLEYAIQNVTRLRWISKCAAVR